MQASEYERERERELNLSTKHTQKTSCLRAARCLIIRSMTLGLTGIIGTYSQSQPGRMLITFRFLSTSLVTCSILFLLLAWSYLDGALLYSDI